MNDRLHISGNVPADRAEVMSDRPLIVWARDGKKLTIHGSGQTRRNFIWAEDVATATEIILNKGNIGEVYNIGTTQEFSVLDVANLLIKKMTTDGILENHITYVEDRPFNDFRYAITNEKLKELGWSERFTNFEENIQELIRSSRHLRMEDSIEGKGN
jgi:dTDP-D-glucose 4,6-dehydratase